VYQDRATGATFRGPFEMVNAYLARLSEGEPEPVVLDPNGYAQLRRGLAVVGINVLEEHGVLMLLAPVGPVPNEQREAFYRRLLEASFLATADAAFAIDHKNDVVYVRALRRLSGLDYEELFDLVRSVAKVAEGFVASMGAAAEP
jgi:Tir chaperone protein (CesT) family